MTTINLGKIKPLYKGAYGAGITYRPLDFTMYNDQLYVCKAASTGNLPSNTAFFDPVTAAVTAATLGLGNVNNTSDANKPVSTPQQTALNAKANLASPAFTGTPTAPTAAAGVNSTQLATTAYALAAAALRYGKNNVLGTVSQSAGVPTGAVIERGSNAIGQYVRFADGTMFCVGRANIGEASWMAGAQFSYSGPYVFSFPASFAAGSTPVVALNFADPAVSVRAAYVTSFSPSVSGVTGIYLASPAPSLAVGSTQACHFTATGRWY